MGDESAAKDQNVALAILLRVLDQVPHIHIATIGHTGKDENRGERGSNAKLADVDLQVQLTGDTVRSAIVKKGNDQAEGPLTSFRLEPYEFRDDEDGDPFKTFIVSNDSVPDVPASRQRLSSMSSLYLLVMASRAFSSRSACGCLSSSLTSRPLLTPFLGQVHVEGARLFLRFALKAIQEPRRKACGTRADLSAIAMSALCQKET